MISINLLIFLLSLTIIVKGSNYFVKSAAKIAKKLNISEFIIGLTLIAIGTSLPELFSSIIASLQKESGLIIGTILGANIANLGLVIGTAAVLTTFKVKKEIVKRDMFIVLGISILFFLFAINKTISRIEGIILFIIFIAYIMFILEKNQKKSNLNEFISYFIKFSYISSIKNNLTRKKSARKNNSRITKEILILILSGAAIIIAANFLVSKAILFAEFLNMSSSTIGIMIAIGTTLPEMSVTVTAARKGFGGIAIGNALGSCITNTLLIIGIASVINPLNFTNIILIFTIPVFILFTIILIIFVIKDWQVKKQEGIILLVLYVSFLVLSLILPKVFPKLI